MSNFFQEFKIADEKTCGARWGGMPNGALFYCAFCGEQFTPGKSYKAIYTNDLRGAGGNPLCCGTCYAHNGGTDEKMRELRQARSKEWDDGYKGKWRWFQDHRRRESHREDDRSWQREINETARAAHENAYWDALEREREL